MWGLTPTRLQNAITGAFPQEQLTFRTNCCSLRKLKITAANSWDFIVDVAEICPSKYVQIEGQEQIV